MRVAEAIKTDAKTEHELRALSKGRRVEARVQQRASVILLAAQGWQNKDIAEEVRLDRRQVALWRKRFIEGGVQALMQDAPRSGRTPKVDAELESHIVLTTQNEPPPEGASWSTRSLASHLELSASTVRRVWQRHGIQPNAMPTGLNTTSAPACVGDQLVDVVGLYMNAHQRALVLSCGERNEAPVDARARPERAEPQCQEEVRLGAKRLLAALRSLERVAKASEVEHDRQHWLRFLQRVERHTPEAQQLHLIVDGHETHKHPAVQSWLSKHPRVYVHFPLASAAWLKRVKRNLSDICEQGISLHSFTGVPPLLQAIEQYSERQIDRRQPFWWAARGARAVPGRAGAGT